MVVDPVEQIRTQSLRWPGDDRPIFIGQAPSRRGDPSKPLTGRPGRRLAELSGVTPMEFYTATVRTNIVSRYSGPKGGGDAFPMTEARENALRMTEVIGGRAIVLVGRKVTEAFGLKGGWFEWNIGHFRDDDDQVMAFQYASVQHPSGRNRFWNSPDNIQEAREFLSGLMSRESAVPSLKRLRERGRSLGESQTRQRVTKTHLRGATRDTGADRLQEHHKRQGPQGT